METAGFDFNKGIWTYRGADHIKDNPKSNMNYRAESDSIMIITSESNPAKRHKALGIMNMITLSQVQEWINLRRSCYVIKLDSINILPEKRLKARDEQRSFLDVGRLQRIYFRHFFENLNLLSECESEREVNSSNMTPI